MPCPATMFLASHKSLCAADLTQLAKAWRRVMPNLSPRHRSMPLRSRLDRVRSVSRAPMLESAGIAQTDCSIPLDSVVPFPCGFARVQLAKAFHRALLGQAAQSSRRDGGRLGMSATTRRTGSHCARELG